MIIRPAKHSDIENLAALGAATFTNTFGHLYKPEDLAYFLAHSQSTELYEQALASEDQPIWVAEQDERLMAYIKLGPNSLPCDPPIFNAVEIVKLYARTECQSMGIGSQLVLAAENWSRARDYKIMVLSVYSENFDGHRFYRRQGFEKIGEYNFPVGQQLDREWILSKKL